ncbi:MAG: ATP-binding protein [Pseudomonadota bacterium]
MTSKNVWLISTAIVLLFLSFSVYVFTEKQVDRAYELRHTSYQLANQLRQSSDELTRMVRTYVVTGDTSFKTNYQTILDIRNGIKPRPAGYFTVYWDLFLANPLSRQPVDGPAIALLELIRQAGFTEAEFSKLAEAKAHSDELTALEFQAMKLAESNDADAENKRISARMMLHDANYHRAKAKIMQPINDLYLMMDQRTLGTIETAKNIATIFRIIFIFTVLASVFALWRTYLSLRATLGGSVNEVREQILKIGSGDFSSPVDLQAKLEGSVLANLVSMRDQLHDFELERQKSAVAVLESEERYRNLVEWSPEPIAVHRHGKLLYINPAAIKLFGAKSAMDLVGKPILELVHPDSHKIVMARIKNFMESGKNGPVSEQRYLKLDGTAIDVEVQGTSLIYDGEPAIYVAVRDITERRRLEKLKAEFVSTVSHELRTPLTSIHGSLKLLEAGVGGAIPESAMKLVSIAQKNSQRLMLLINDLLDMEKIDAGKVSLRLTPLDLVSEVKQAIQDNAGYATTLKVKFVLGAHPQQATVLADSNRVAQVMANLLSNAAKFSGDAHQIDIRILLTDDTARVEVEDHGSGIPLDFQKEVFGAFAQANTGNTRQQGGTGLGLKISKSIIDAMQGEIGFDSTPDVGTTFWFTLPRFENT